MTRELKLFVGSSLLLAIAGAPLDASAVDIVRFKGRSADAFFESRSGCIGTVVNVFASERVLGSPSNTGEVFVEINRFDTCNNDEPILAASGSAPITPANFQVDANLGAATLDATVTVFDTLTPDTFEVNIEDLNWTATSSRGHQNGHTNFLFQGCHINTRVNAAFRLAEAFGTVSDGATNFTPDASLAGNLFSVNSGDRSQGC